MLKHIHIVQPGRMSVVYSHETSFDDIDAILESVFGGWNAGSGQECDEFLKSRTRSLSVGDFVGLNGKFYQCESFGWNEVPRATVNIWCENVEARMVETGEDSWQALNHFRYASD